MIKFVAALEVLVANKEDEDEVAARRDQTIKNMIRTPPKTQKGAPKRTLKSSPNGKRGS